MSKHRHDSSRSGSRPFAESRPQPDDRMESRVDTRRESQVNARKECGMDARIESQVNARKKCGMDARKDSQVNARKECGMDAQMDNQVDARKECGITDPGYGMPEPSPLPVPDREKQPHMGAAPETGTAPGMGAAPEKGVNPETVHFAAIDIGSNAVRLTVKSIEKDPADDTLCLGQDLLVRFPLRLGEDSFKRGKISSSKTKELLHLMKSFRQMLKIFPRVQLRACATSAMRDAANGEEITRMIRKKTGIDIEIIDGQQEARIVYQTHIERELGERADYMYMDVGGGSTQISLIVSGELVYSHSFNIGTVRLMNGLVEPAVYTDFIGQLRRLRARYPHFKLVGSGGNINKLIKLVHGKKSATVMSVDKLRELNAEMAPLAVENRMKRYKIKRDRAEVISFAADIFLSAAEAMDIREITAPSISISDGIINRMFGEYVAQNHP